MHLIRRSAFRAASSTSFISKSRSITTASPFLLRSKAQSGISSSVFRRFNSDEAERKDINDADHDEQSSVRSAIDSASETASTYAHDAAESLTNGAEQAKESVYDGASAAAAATGFGRRSDDDSVRGYGGDRDTRGGGYGGERGGYGGDRGGFGGDRGGFGGDRRGGLQSGGRPPVERNLTPTAGVYIGNLLFDVTADDLTKEFQKFGAITSAVIASDARGLSKGFGYVEFETTEQATAAIEAKHQTVYEGRRLIVNYMARTRRESTPNPPSKTLFIGNLAFEMSDADLNKLFRDIRNVIDVRVAIDRRTGQPRGFAHADFIDVDSAVKGLESLKDKEIYGRKLRVDYSSGTASRREGGNDRGAAKF